MKVRLTESAENDLARAFEWYEKHREDLGYRFMARIDDTIDSISNNPRLFAALIGDARRAFVEQFPYAIWYRIERDGILVIGCLHHKRDPEILSDRAT